MSVLDKVRKWIDGETAEGVLEDAARDAQVKPRSKAEEFIVKIARSVEEVMQNEMVPLPQGTVIIPTEYTIFLSSEDDKEWKGVKRRGLEQGLYHILAERAREIAGKKKLETEAFLVKFSVDGTLEKSDVRVQHSWEDASQPKTQILSREKLGIPEPAPQPSAPATDPNFNPNPQPVPTAPPPPQRTPAPSPQPGLDGSPSPIEFAPPSSYPPPSPQPTEQEDMTHVAKRKSELFKLEIWRNGTRINVVPIGAHQIVVGRGSKTKPVDISLPGDPEISRRHVVIMTDGAGSFWVVNEGRNPATVNNQELQTGLRVKVPPGTPIGVCSYVLRVQP